MPENYILSPVELVWKYLTILLGLKALEKLTFSIHEILFETINVGSKTIYHIDNTEEAYSSSVLIRNLWKDEIFKMIGLWLCKVTLP